MLDGATEAKPGLRGQPEHVCPVPDLRTGGVIVLPDDRLGGNSPYRDHQEVLWPVKEEGVVVCQRRRVGTGIPDLHLGNEGRVCDIRDIEEGELDPARGDPAPFTGRRLLADADDVRCIVGVEVIRVAGDLQLAEDLRVMGRG